VTAQLRAEFQELMDAWSEAVVADDPEAFASFAEPDWVLIGENGALARDVFLELVATGQISHHTMAHEVHDLRLYDNIAVMLSRGKSTGNYQGLEFELDEWITEVFIHRPDGWKCIVTHLTNATGSSQQ
jgi:ketosteroid isomerase-like protein